jgi:hypothetical protein
MKISKIHQTFSDLLEDPKVLTNPEDFLGPNWEDVINFWFYIDTLTKDEREKMGVCYWHLDHATLDSAYNASRCAATEVVERVVANKAWGAIYDVSDWYIFGYVTYELIAQHKLLEQDKPLTFLPLLISKIP